MIKFFMHKTAYIVTILILFITSLNAKEPMTAILSDIVSNDLQKLIIGKYDYYCKPYGVISMEDIYNAEKSTQECKKSILDHYKANPDLKYFSELLLDIKQSYHLEFRQSRCILYAKGENTLSELLLKSGLAVLKTKFKDDEFIYAFNRSQNIAKAKEMGVWSEDILKNCKEFYEE